jgi:hypothetical protein
MDDCPFPASPTTSDEFEKPSPGLLDQRVFFFDQTGSERLEGQQTSVLIDAIAIAHRLIFSPKSLQILYSSLHLVFESEMMWRKGWNVGYQPHIAPALLAFAVKDGMYLILDRKTHQGGYVRIGEPRGLRISATVSHVRKWWTSVDDTVGQRSDESRDAVHHDLSHSLVSSRFSSGAPYLP